MYAHTNGIQYPQYRKAHSNHLNGCVPAVCGRRLQCHFCLTGGAGPSRSNSLQLPEFIQSVASGQIEGGVPLQGWPQQEKEAEEQTQTLPPYVWNKTHKQTQYFDSPYSNHFCFQLDLMISLMLRPWMPSAIEPSASTWQHILRALAMDIVWSFIAR